MPEDFSQDPALKPLRDFGAATAIVLGSGLGALADAAQVEHAVDFSAVAGLPTSTVPGHRGRLIAARLASTPVLLAQGRVHLYEGHPPAAVAATVRALASCGVSQIILTNAAGSLNPKFHVGSWMAIADHLNLTALSPLTGSPHFVDLTAAYDPAWREEFALAAAQLGIPLHLGIYAGLPGPHYETPAEIRMLRALGADAVGMSTVLETIQARALGLRVAAFSCLTNAAAGLSGNALDHADVVATGQAAAAQMVALLSHTISNTPAADV
jgi:purine-nucleoside phosphorylase